MKNKGFLGALAVLISFALLLGAGSLSTQQILNNAYDSTTGTLQLSMSTGTWKDTTALTNTTSFPGNVQHETTGTPANGIGTGFRFTTETTAGNEIGSYIESVATDVTSGSEDFEFNVGNMVAGAAASEVLSISSTGVVSLVNGETIDNTVNGTVTYTATTHAFVGNETVSGSLDIVGAAGLILANDETLTNAVNGTVLVTAPITATSGALDVTGGTITLENDEVIDNSADGTILLTSPVVEVSAALKLEFETSDPCGTFPEGSIFYNDTGNFMCFCDQSGDDLKISDGNACF